MSILNERIKQQRIKHGFTLRDIAEMLGVQRAAINKYENGQIKNIKSETVEKLATIFNCSPSYLMGWTDDADQAS